MSAFCTNTIFPKQVNTWTVFWATVLLNADIIQGPDFWAQKYNILASQNILDHVIWIKTHRVLG